MSQTVQGEPDYPSIKDQAVDVERERCARIAELMGHPDIADEIRSWNPVTVLAPASQLLRQREG